MDTLVDDLTAALNRLDRYGWIKGDWGSDDGPGCMDGHVQHVVNRSLDRWNAASEALMVALPHVGSVLNFNDDPTTTLADVRAVFCRAIETAQAAIEVEVCQAG